MRLPGLVEHGTSRQHLLGCVLASIGAALAWLDPVGLSGVVLVVAFYAVGFVAGRAWEAEPWAFDPVRQETALQEEVARLSDRLPPEILGQLCRIKDVVRLLVLPRLEVLPAGSVDRYLVERTVVDYLPSALEQYLVTDGTGALEDPGLSPTAARQLLGDQLRLMEEEMRRVASAIQQANLDRMLAHQRFLRERFGRLDPSS